MTDEGRQHRKDNKEKGIFRVHGVGDYYMMRWDGGSMPLHRWLWEMEYGPIPQGFEVHHINEDRTDNELINLQLLTPKAHARIHKGWERQEDGSWLKPCTDCRELLTTDHFYRSGPGKLHPRCKSCHNAAQRAFRESQR